MTNCFYLFIILSIILLVIYSILALVIRFVKCSHFTTKIIIEILFNKPTHTHIHNKTIYHYVYYNSSGCYYRIFRLGFRFVYELRVNIFNIKSVIYNCSSFCLSTELFLLLNCFFLVIALI